MRKEIDYTVSTPGRDLGKTFHIREMGAMQAEKWALRALRAAVKGGADLGPEVVAAGVQGIVIAGIQALFHSAPEDIEPLLDEMMACVTIKPDPKNPAIQRPLIEDDIEEVRTLIDLRMEVLKLHTDFFGAASPSTSEPEISQSPASPNTPMSRTRAPRSSPQVGRR